ncbi:MAG: MotA/TolQ/ExbB proton channel family protein [Planctomycetota bacterium]
MNIPPAAEPATPPVVLDSVFDMVMNGGPLMVPIALCSVVALAYTVERSVRLRPGELGTKRLGRDILDAVERDGPQAGLKVCKERKKPLARILGAGLGRFGSPMMEVEKAVEDAGEREVRRLSANLRPLVVVGMIAPLLGLLGTVWGMIEAFSSIALQDGLGKPELLASGISQALITTAAGLAIAIPAQAIYYFFRGRIDRFVRSSEDLYLELEQKLEHHRFPRIDAGSAS